MDRPATQARKLERRAEAGIAVPESVAHAAVDFERQDLRAVLDETLAPDRPVLFWWLGAVARLGEPWVSEYAYPELAEVVRRSGSTEVRPEDEGVTIRRCLGLTPPDSQSRSRPSLLALATRGWPRSIVPSGQPRS